MVRSITCRLRCALISVLPAQRSYAQRMCERPITLAISSLAQVVINFQRIRQAACATLFTRNIVISVSLPPSLSLSLSLSAGVARVSQKHAQTAPSFLSMLPVAMAWSSYAGVAVRCVFPVLQRTSSCSVDCVRRISQLILYSVRQVA